MVRRPASPSSPRAPTYCPTWRPDAGAPDVATDHPIHRIVLTGGPCGGKTTALAHIAERLQSLGFGVYLVPEAYTLLYTGGASAQGFSTEQLLRFQAAHLRLL